MTAHAVSPTTRRSPYEVLQLIKQELVNLAQKVASFAKAVFKAIVTVVLFPTRYLGGKTWSIPGVILRLPGALFKKMQLGDSFSLKKELFGSGYHFSFQKRLTPDELKPFLPYACATACVHTSNPEWMAPLGYKVVQPKDFGIRHHTIESHENCFFDKNTGLKVTVLENDKRFIIAFGALQSSKSELPDQKKLNEKIYTRFLKDIFGNTAGGTPAIFSQTERLVYTLLKSSRLANKPVTFAGQCYGGSLASYLGIKYKKKTTCLNPLPLGAGMQKKLGKKALSRADKYVTHITVEGDWLTDPGFIRTTFDRLVTAVGIRTPGNFGKRFTIPSAYDTARKAHDYSVGSVISHLGFDKMSKPKDIPAEYLQSIS